MGKIVLNKRASLKNLIYNKCANISHLRQVELMVDFGYS